MADKGCDVHFALSSSKNNREDSMERDRKGRLPWAIVLLILVFACGIAIAGALIYANLTNRSSHSSYQGI